MKTILVAIDFSPASRKAFLYGVHLARHIKAELIAVYVVNTTDLRFALREQIPGVMNGSSEQLKIKVNKHIEGLFRPVVRHYAKSYKRIHTCWVRGTPAIEISRIARRVAAELIVMGTRGHSVLADVVLGSTSLDLIRRAPCPVATVRVDTRISRDSARRKSSTKRLQRGSTRKAKLVKRKNGYVPVIN